MVFMHGGAIIRGSTWLHATVEVCLEGATHTGVQVSPPGKYFETEMSVGAF